MTERIIDPSLGVVACSHKKVAIIGAGMTRARAPWADDSWCFWALNEISQPRYDRHFELHPMAVQSKTDLGWLATCDVPCYVLNLDEAQEDPGDGNGPRVQNAVLFPLDRVVRATGGRRYFTCTFAYQIALAIAEEFEEIGIWGVDLALGTLRERLVENPCVAYWTGLAEGRGVVVTVPDTSTLCRQDLLYGYDYHEERRWVDERCDEAVAALPKERWRSLLKRLAEHYGALDSEADVLKLALESARVAAGRLTDEEYDAVRRIADAADARAIAIAPLPNAGSAG